MLCCLWRNELKINRICNKSNRAIVSLQDKHVKEQQIDHWKKIISIQEQLKTNQNRVSLLRDKIEDLHKQYKEIESAPGTRDIAQEFNFRSVFRHP